jgi:Ca-activated chloride channel homolog
MKTGKFKWILPVLVFMTLMTGFTAAEEITLSISVSNPILLAEQRQTTFLKIGLTGFELADTEERTPVNVALVIDRSGSMDGEKMTRAKEAARMAIDLLDRRDIVSVIAYSDSVNVLVPATKVTDRRYIKNKIDSLYADGNTALFAGVSKGAEEVLKFAENNKVNRVILISDGLANVGPDSPAALGDLGGSLRKSGISVTTIGLGLGYNEDLMVRLAEKSDGNHAFVENSRDLARVFEYEFGDILSVVAQEVEIRIKCSSGIKPVRILGREAEIIGSNVITSINQLYSNQEKYILLEVEVDSHEEGDEIRLADVAIQYNNMQSRKKETLTDNIDIGFTQSKTEVEEQVDAPTMVSAVTQIAAEKSEEAVILRDKGMIKEAQAALREGSQFLQKNADILDSDDLAGYGAQMEFEAEVIADEEEWTANRKKMVDDQYSKQSQQSY